MPEPTAGFPADWLDPRRGVVASDLDVAVLLVNTVDLLEPEPDRLGDLRWFRAVLREVGHDRLAGQLRNADLPGLRTLRERLRPVFGAADLPGVAAILNPLLRDAGAVALLDLTGDAPRLTVGTDRRGLAALEARLPTALAEHVVAHGTGRFGTCSADPCACAFVDRTRAGTRRYCCSYCNDRAAARAYRRRRSTGGSS